MPEGSQLSGIDFESLEQKKAQMNRNWRDESRVFGINGEQLNLKQLYEKEVERSEKAFKEAHNIAEQIPEGKFILFVDNVGEGEGPVYKPEFKLLDEDRRKMVYKAETGSDDLDQDFQPENMRYRLGIDKDNNEKFRVFKSFKDIVPTDLTNCVGVVYSGSTINIKNEENPTNIEATNKVLEIIKMATSKGIPQLGVCFGSQVLAHSQGVEIEYVNEENPLERISGITQVIKTEFNQDKPDTDFTDKLSNNVYVAQNHGQQAKAESVKEHGGIILATSSSGATEVTFFHPNIYGCQSHIEVGPTRVNAAQSFGGEDTNPTETFSKNCASAGEILFPEFLKIVVKYSKGH